MDAEQHVTSSLAKADPIFTVSDRAARQLHEHMGDRIALKDNPALGPIQGIVLEKL